MTWSELLFRFDSLSVTVGALIIFFTALTGLYSIESMRGHRRSFQYGLYVLLTSLVALAAVAADNLLFLLVCWGLLGLLLYLLIGFGQTRRTPQTAKKAFIIIGATDGAMLLGLAILWALSRRGGEDLSQLALLRMSEVQINLSRKAATAAYLCFAAGALAKAGCMPFHTWVPDTAEDAPTAVTAFLPASLDKLLGIYLLTRISFGLFNLSHDMRTLLMACGSATIIIAVMMALVQHDMNRLLGYHAVSQVGYMVLGIGTGNPIGMVGALFHMVNNTLYKSCLFYSGGAVARCARTADLERLGGFARVMPITFASFLVASLAICGVPPLNGFASKWMIYQGIILAGRPGGTLWVLWLTAAMFGSALTLASFLKLLHAIFLGRPHPDLPADLHEATPCLWAPGILLAALCVALGLAARHLPFDRLPGIGPEPIDRMALGFWQPVTATILALVGLVAGLLIYGLGSAARVRRVEPFIGGEQPSEQLGMRVSGVDFYLTIRAFRSLGSVYRMAERKAFDIYEVGTALTLGLSKMLGTLHNGALPRYLAWCLLGTLVLLFVLRG